MKNPHEIVDDCFAFFSQEELLQQHRLLHESEVAVMWDELTASREKIANLVVMLTSNRPQKGREKKSTSPSSAQPRSAGRERRWVARLIGLLKIGIGLANLILGLLKH